MTRDEIAAIRARAAEPVLDGTEITWWESLVNDHQSDERGFCTICVRRSPCLPAILASDLLLAHSQLHAARTDIPRLCDHLERAMEVIGAVYAWSQAYPLDVFPEPDLQRARELLEAGGMSLDAVSASAIRHAVKAIGEDAADFLRDAGATGE